MNLSARKSKILEKLFGLSDEGIKTREYWRSTVIPVACAMAGIVSASITIVGGVQDGISMLVTFAVHFVKYFPIFWVVNNFAQRNAANYLNDIFEIENDQAAMNFIESVVFGHSSGSEAKITVKDGKISAADEQSPIMLIGGPGAVKVGLDHLIMSEKFNGEPSIFHSSDKPWKIGRYERIREVGEHQYAIINLRDQFFSGISVKSRTKDGIPIEAQDVKVIFSILRKKPTDGSSARDASTLYDPEAVKSLVYNQTMTDSDSQTFGATFPWDNIMLMIVSEIEDLIKTSSLSEILSNIGQKEVDARIKTQQSIETIRIELTKLNKTIPRAQGSRPDNTPNNFKSRSMITARFYEPEFVKKAAQAGIQLHWIDIGTWKTPAEKIMEQHKEAWNRSLDNASKKMKQEKTKDKKAQAEFVNLVNNIIVKKYEKAAGATGKTTSRFNNKEDSDEDEEEDYMEYGVAHRLKQDDIEKNPEHLALEILKAIRKELLTGKYLVQQEDEKIIGALDNALEHINSLTSHYVGS